MNGEIGDGKNGKNGRDGDVLDCQVCGACCSHRWSWPVLRRDRADAVGIPAGMVRDDLPLMRTKGDRCVALSGVVGVLCGCSVYPVRPEACRKFVPGGVLCLEARAKLGVGRSEGFLSDDC